MPRTRFSLTTGVVFLCSCLGLATAAQAQGAQDRWRGAYASVTFGAQPGRMDAGNSTELIHQITNLTVNGTLIVVPTTTASVLGENYEHAAFQMGLHAGVIRPIGTWFVGIEGGIEFAWGSSDIATQNFQIPASLLTPVTMVTVTRQAESTTGWTLFGRAGRIVGKDFLVYGTAGITGAGRKLIAVDTWSNVPGGPGLPGPGGGTVNLGPLGPYVVTATENRHTGALIGMGVEKPMNNVWSWALDYQYAYFPEATFLFDNADVEVQGPNSTFQTFQDASAAAVPGATPVKSTDHRLAFKINYRLPFTIPFMK